MIYAIIIAAMPEVQSYEPKETTTFLLQEKTGKSDDRVVYNTACRHPDFSVENAGYHFAV